MPGSTVLSGVSFGPAHPATTDLRNVRRAAAARAMATAETAIAAALRQALVAQRALVLGRLRGRKARQGTRHWDGLGDGAQTKALRPDYILPERGAADVIAAVRPTVSTQLALAIGAAVSVGNAGPGDPIGVQSSIVQDAIAREITRLTGLVGADADRIRELISSKDDAGADIADLVRSIDDAYDADPMPEAAARAVTIGGMNGGSLDVARAAGVQLKQWLSSHDERVRPTHAVADGQVKGIDQPFKVGTFELQYPGDDSGWPESAPEVAGCRCVMIFSKPPRAVKPGSWQSQPDTATARLRAQRELDRLLAADTARTLAGAQAQGPQQVRLAAPLVVFASADALVAAQASVGATMTVSTPVQLTPLSTAAAVDSAGALVQVELPAGSVVSWVNGASTVTAPAGSSFEVLAVSPGALSVRMIVPGAS